MTGGEDRFWNYGKGEAFKIMDKKPTGYDVGALMYCPANGHDSIVDGLKNERFARPFSLAFCLEDTVRDDEVDSAVSPTVFPDC